MRAGRPTIQAEHFARTLLASPHKVYCWRAGAKEPQQQVDAAFRGRVDNDFENRHPCSEHCSPPPPPPLFYPALFNLLRSHGSTALKC